MEMDVIHLYKNKITYEDWVRTTRQKITPTQFKVAFERITDLVR